MRTSNSGIDVSASSVLQFGPARLLLGLLLLAAGALTVQRNAAFAQKAENKNAASAQARTSTAAPPCSEPSPCPAPDNTQDPEVTCYEPHSASIEKNIRLHVYGKYLVKEDGPPRRMIYRNDKASGPGGRTNDDVEVESACHVVTTLYIKEAPSVSTETTMEFRLLREQPTREEYREGSMGDITDWHTIDITP